MSNASGRGFWFPCDGAGSSPDQLRGSVSQPEPAIFAASSVGPGAGQDTRLGLAFRRKECEPTGELPRLGPVAAARAEAGWFAGDRDAVEEATVGALRLALERKSVWMSGALFAWRRRAGIDGEILPNTAKLYALQLAGDWRRAAALWRDLGCPSEAALTLAGADEEEPLRTALQELQRLEARPVAAIVARRLRRQGGRGVPRGPHARTRENLAGLTARELDVIVLVAEGLRNVEIAERLVVSEKTVDHHVSAILGKLDVQTRGEAAAEAVRLGLTARR